MSISTTVKTIQDIMRIDEGVDGDAQRISQLTWMIFLKIFDDREMEYEAFEDDYVSPLPKELRWRNWATEEEGITGDELLEFVNNNLFRTLKNLNLEVVDGRGRILKNAFEDAFNFMKNGTLMRQVINKLNEIDFNNSQEKLLEECNLHTIVRLPNGVFNPYTGIKTNLLFFTKGGPTQEVWFYEHPYPSGYKSYNKTKPIWIEEFEPEKAWWHNRVENDFAWKVSVEEIKANGYNLDIKNPYQEKEKHRDLETMLVEYQELMAEVSETRNLLKAELMAALSKSVE